MVYLGLIVNTLRRYGKVSGKGERRSGFGVPPSGVGGMGTTGTGMGVAIGGGGLGLSLGPERTEEGRGRERIVDERRREEGGGTAASRREAERDTRKDKEKTGGFRSALGLGLTNLGERGGAARNSFGEELLELDLEKGEAGTGFNSGEDSGNGYNSSTPKGM